MNESPCRHEQQVVDAASGGRWTPQLTAHIAHCADCADLALVSGLLRATEEPRDLEVDLAQAGRIWRRADAERRRKQADKAMLPLTIGELSACLFGGVALVGFATHNAVSLAQGMDVMGQRLLADPLVTLLGAVVAVLLVGVGFFSLILALGFGVARS